MISQHNVVDNMNSSRSCGRSSRCYEQLRAVDDMNNLRSRELKGLDAINNIRICRT